MLCCFQGPCVPAGLVAAFVRATPLRVQQPFTMSLQGGIYFNQGSMPLLRVTLRNNTAVRNGGGVLQTSFQGAVTNATFIANRAGTRQAVLLLSWLAGLHACGCRVQLQKPGVYRLILNGYQCCSCTLRGHTKWPLHRACAAVPLQRQHLCIAGFARLCTASCRCVLRRPLVLSVSGGSRRATCSGGALFSASSGGIISDTLFQQNSASLGGAIWENAGRLTITGSNLTANGAESGGAIYEVRVAQADCLTSGSPC